jgi:hypothetical protein
MLQSSIAAYTRRALIHRAAVERHGLYSGRIVELLTRRKYLEQQQIADLAIMPVREARERLYKLYRLLLILVLYSHFQTY